MKMYYDVVLLGNGSSARLTEDQSMLNSLENLSSTFKMWHIHCSDGIPTSFVWFFEVS